MDLMFGRNKFGKKIASKLQVRKSLSKKSLTEIHKVPHKLLLLKIISNRLNKFN